MTSRRRGVGLTPMETRRDVIVRAAVLADELAACTAWYPGMPWGTVEATLRAAAPGA